MGENTAIGWASHSWNPWHGCIKVSPGCKHCYMYRDKEKYGQDPRVVVRSKTTFNAPLKWRDPALVFTCSWSDFFIEEADPWRDEAWEIIRRTPHLTYQILTKRPERMEGRLPWTDEPWPNVWLGTSVETQKEANERIYWLLLANAALHFISYEPALDGVDFTSLRLPQDGGPLSPKDVWLDCLGREIVNELGLAYRTKRGVGWLIVGGESGPGHRPMDIAWVESVFRQCRAAGVPIYVKQDSGMLPGKQGRIPDALWIHEWPESAPIGNAALAISGR